MNLLPILRFNLITSAILLISFFFKYCKEKGRLIFNFGCLIFVMEFKHLECHESYKLVGLVMPTLNPNFQIWFGRIISFLILNHDPLVTSF